MFSIRSGHHIGAAAPSPVDEMGQKLLRHISGAAQLDPNQFRLHEMKAMIR